MPSNHSIKSVAEGIAKIAGNFVGLRFAYNQTPAAAPERNEPARLLADFIPRDCGLACFLTVTAPPSKAGRGLHSRVCLGRKEQWSIHPALLPANRQLKAIPIPALLRERERYRRLRPCQLAPEQTKPRR
jgi:hypothetical protein